MHSRMLHAVASCVLFLLIATVYSQIAGHELDPWRLAFWSMVGIAAHVGASHLFGFDPRRTRVAQYAPSYVHYVDRWELRLGQATLSMLGCVVLASRLIDPEHFVTAVVSGTLSAWTYFVLRLYAGGYREADRLGQRSR